MHRTPAVRVRRGVTVLLVAVVAACDASPLATSAPAGPVQSGPKATFSDNPSGTQGPATTRAPGSGAPDPGTPEPLPVPTLLEPGIIGEALYDPSRVADAVVSLLAALGVGIVAADGTVLRAAEDRGIGLLALTEAEVRGWIDMTVDDYAAFEQGGGAIRVRDLHEALSTSLPAGYSLDAFVGAYQRAYAERFDAFVPQLMLGMPIEADTGLLRIQAWALLLDGFVRSAPAATARTASFRGAAAPRWGSALAPQPGLAAAQAYQPPLVSPDPSITDAEWEELMAYLPTLAFRIPFAIGGGSFGHEGHGRQGDAFQQTARYEVPDYLMSVRSRRVILFTRTAADPIDVTWFSNDERTLNRHGTIQGQLRSPIRADAGGAVHISYTLRQERADGRGEQVTEIAHLGASVDQLALVKAVYELGLAAVPALLLIEGRRDADHPELIIDWHEEDTIELGLSNPYDFKLDVSAGPTLFTIARIGTDGVSGSLVRGEDDIYRGTLVGYTEGTADGTSLVGECHDHSQGDQYIYVVGRPESWSGVVDPRLEQLESGAFGPTNLHLSFYPAGAPSGTFTLCQPLIPFTGGGPDNRPAGHYLPFNDTRWSDPSTGYVIHLPNDSDTLVYKDLRQYQVTSPGGGGLPGVWSNTFWDVRVTDNGITP